MQLVGKLLLILFVYPTVALAFLVPVSEVTEYVFKEVLELTGTAKFIVHLAVLTYEWWVGLVGSALVCWKIWPKPDET